MPTIIEITRAYILRGEAYGALQEHFTEGGFKDYTGNGRINIFSTEYGGKGERWAEE